MSDAKLPAYEAYWTSDQALIWIASRDFRACARASRARGAARTKWVAFRAEWLDQAEGDHAEGLLLQHLQHQSIRADDDEDQEMDPKWLGDASWVASLEEDDAPSMLLRRRFASRLIGEWADGTRIRGRREEELAHPRMKAADVIAAFPFDGAKVKLRLVVNNPCTGDSDTSTGSAKVSALRLERWFLQKQEAGLASGRLPTLGELQLLARKELGPRLSKRVRTLWDNRDHKYRARRGPRS